MSEMKIGTEIKNYSTFKCHPKHLSLNYKKIEFIKRLQEVFKSQEYFSLYNEMHHTINRALVLYFIDCYREVYSDTLTGHINGYEDSKKWTNSIFHFLNSFEEGEQMIQCLEKLIGIDLRTVCYYDNNNKNVEYSGNLFITLFNHIDSEETFYKLIENELAKGVNPKYFGLFLEWNKSILPPNIFNSMEIKDVKNWRFPQEFPEFNDISVNTNEPSTPYVALMYKPEIIKQLNSNLMSCPDKNGNFIQLLFVSKDEEETYNKFCYQFSVINHHSDNKILTKESWCNFIFNFYCLDGFASNICSRFEKLIITLLNMRGGDFKVEITIGELFYVLKTLETFLRYKYLKFCLQNIENTNKSLKDIFFEKPIWKDDVKSNPLFSTIKDIHSNIHINGNIQRLVRMIFHFDIVFGKKHVFRFSDLFNDKLNTPLVFKANKNFGCFSKNKIADFLSDKDEYDFVKIIEDDNYVELHIPPLLEILLESITLEAQLYLKKSSSDRCNDSVFISDLKMIICFILSSPNNPNYISTYPQAHSETETNYLTLNSFMDKLIQNLSDIVWSNFEKHIDYEYEYNTKLNKFVVGESASTSTGTGTSTGTSTAIII